MAVYIDDAFLPFGRMKMCHLVADTVEELQAFARQLEMKSEWFQDHRIPHYDVSMQVRGKAVALGAIETSYGFEVWRCEKCIRPKLACTKRLKCKCEAETDETITPTE